jgi:hypothetical protein
MGFDLILLHERIHHRLWFMGAAIRVNAVDVARCFAVVASGRYHKCEDQKLTKRGGHGSAYH